MHIDEAIKVFVDMKNNGVEYISFTTHTLPANHFVYDNITHRLKSVDQDGHEGTMGYCKFCGGRDVGVSSRYPNGICNWCSKEQ
jgi:hypothetical protein